MTAHQPAGTHVLADLHGVDAALLRDAPALDALLRTAAQAAGATVLFSHFHAFGAGQGVTGVVLLAESHITIHTWPECEFAAADIFMCGASTPQVALEAIEQALQPVTVTVQVVERGAARPVEDSVNAAAPYREKP
jgi:S-adenosylmethionine decarboxylase